MASAFTAQELRDLHLVYASLDPGARGRLDCRELRRALRILGFKVSRSRVHELLREWAGPAGAAGAGGEGEGVGVETFLQVVSRLQGSAHDSHEELEQAFAALDQDGDGFLSAADLRASARGAGLSLSGQEIEVRVPYPHTTLTSGGPPPQGMLEEAGPGGAVSIDHFVRVMLRTNLFQ